MKVSNETGSGAGSISNKTFDAHPQLLNSGCRGIERNDADAPQARLEQLDRGQQLAKDFRLVSGVTDGVAGQILQTVAVERAIDLFERFVGLGENTAGIEQPLQVAADRAFHEAHGLGAAQRGLDLRACFPVDEPIQHRERDADVALISRHDLP